MKITVSSLNEYCFVPDIVGNLKEPKERQFRIYIKKVNSTLTAGKWSKFEKDGNFEIDLKAKIKEQIVRLENAPVLNVDGKQDVTLTIDILMSDKYHELFSVQTQVLEFIGKLEREGPLETKKS